MNLKYLGWPNRGYIKTAENGDFCEELCSENDFETVLATFCCYDHGANVSTSEDRYRSKRVSQMLLVYYNLLNSQKYKYRGKLICGLKNNIRNLVNFHASSRKSENLHFDQILLSKAYKDLDEKLQKSYVS